MELTSRIERLEAESVIRRLVADYCHGFDKRDWDRFFGVWHDGAVWAILDAEVSSSGCRRSWRRVRECGPNMNCCRAITTMPTW